MENIKFIDITQLPEDLWQDAKNLIAIDSNGEVIKAAKQDSYTKDEIDDLLRDAEISADKLQNKIQINSASTDYIVTQPTVSGDSLVITDSMSDKNQYHTFGYDKTITTTSNVLLNNSTPLFRGSNEYNCPQWDGNSIKFQYITGMKFRSRLSIPYKYNGNKYVTHIDAYIQSSMFFIEFGYINEQNFVGYSSVPFKKSEVYKTYGAYEIFSAKIGASMKNYDSQGGTTFYDYISPNNEIQITIGNFPLTASNGELEIETPRFYILSNNFIYGDVKTERQSSDYPERLSDYIRYSNDVKAYILTDKNTKFKTINGEQITGDGNIEISTDVDLSNLATKEELATKQDVINDLETIRNGAALGATALQSVPSEYALKSEIPDITTKQDKLVSGSNIKTINGNSLLGSGNIEIEASAANVPTVQTSVNGTENNYIYSSGRSDKYGVISDFYTAISYYTDNARINTDWYYWGNTSYRIDGSDGWSIKGATTSEAGLMTASDKSKLDGINLATKQDKLVSGENIKTINGTSLLGAGNIEVAANVDLSDYYTKTETNALVNPKLSQVTLTQAEYDALQTKEENVLYVISDAEDIKFKTINGQQITGEGNITIDTNVDLSGYATKSELNAKQDVITDLETIRSGAALGATALQSVPSGYATEQWVNSQGFLKEHQDISNLATKSELNAKQDVISDLETIRSGAALGATALQSVPSTYALKSEIPDITTKQDVLVSGTNIKTINGTSLLGGGNIEVTSNVDLSGYYTKAEIDSMIGGASNTITEINNLVV